MKINGGKLKEWVDVIEIKKDNSGSYVKEVEEHVFEANARFDEVWVRDYQTAISNNTMNDLKMFMRYDDRITNKMLIKRERDGKNYKIKSILFDETNQQYMNLIVERVDV